MSKKVQSYTMFAQDTVKSLGIRRGVEYTCVDMNDNEYVTLTNDNKACVIVKKAYLSITPVAVEPYKFKNNEIIELRSMFDLNAKYNHICGRIKIINRFTSNGKTFYKIITETYGDASKITVTEQQLISILRDKSAEIWKHGAVIDRYKSGYRYFGDYIEATALKKAGDLISDGLIESAIIREHRDKFGKVVIGSNKISLWIRNPHIIE